MVLSFSADALTTPIKKISKTKYFPIELFCANMLPNTPYDAYFDGVLVNSFCKPFGGKLGDPLISDSDGKLTIQFHMAVQYQQQYLATQSDASNIVNTTKSFELRALNGGSSTTYLNLLLKASL